MRSISGLLALGARFSDSLGMDRAVLTAVAGKIWTLGAGLVTTLLIAFYFSPALQGYYYTFNAVLAFQAIAELGLGTVIVSYASHEWAKLRFDEHGRVTGDAASLSRLTSLGRFALVWYLVAGISVTVVLTIGGVFFFDALRDSALSWRAPWIALCMVTGLNFLVVPVLALLEGCNQVSEVYAYRFLQYVACSVAGWTAIYFGAGLWVASIIGFAGLLVIMLKVGRRYGGFVRRILLTRPTGPRLKWQTDILPMQWRIAVSWIGGYFMFSLFTPVLFHYHGPTVAGQMGMTWSLVGALTSIASAWILPKAPGFGILVAQERYAELDRRFWRLTGTVLALVLAGAVGIWSLIFFLNVLNHPLAHRVLSPTVTTYLLLATVIACASLPMSMYLRAHKREPLMALSVASGLATGLGVVVMGKYYSAQGVAIAYLVVTVIVAPIAALIWQRRRNEWHAPAD